MYIFYQYEKKGIVMVDITVKNILEATGGVLLCGDENTVLTDICINSKEAKEGDLFVPIIGTRTDGHRFIESALQTAAATLTSEHGQCCGVGQGVYQGG